MSMIARNERIIMAAAVVATVLSGVLHSPFGKVPELLVFILGVPAVVLVFMGGAFV
jgi:hypothetical protein